MGMKKVEKAIELKIIDLYVNQKFSTVQIGKIIDLSSTGVKKILQRNNIPIRNISESKKGQLRGTQLPVFDIIRLYVEDKKTAREVGEMLQCSHKSVLNILHQNNITVRPSGWQEYHHPKSKEIIAEYSSGLSIKQVSKKLIIPYGTVRLELEKNNLIRTDMKHMGVLGKKLQPWTPQQRDNTYLGRTGKTFEEYLKALPIYKSYKKMVMMYTERQDLEKLENYDKRGRKGYHLDHKFSIYEGLKNNINPEVIGNINNLQMIPAEENLKKYKKCSLSINDLKKMCPEIKNFYI